MENTNARNISAITTNIEHMRDVLEELRTLPVVLAAIQRDQQHIADWQRQVNAMTQSHSTMMHTMDKRITVLERWHKFMLTMPAVALTFLLAVGGYARGYIQAMGQFEHNVLQRITAIEATIHHPANAPTSKPAPIAGGK